MSDQAPRCPGGGGEYPYAPSLDHEFMLEDSNNNNTDRAYHTNNNPDAPYNAHATAPYCQQGYYDSPPGSVTPPGSVDPLPYYPQPPAGTSVDVNLGEWEDNDPWQTSAVPVEDHAQLQLPASPPEGLRVLDTQSFVKRRQDSYDKHEKFKKDPAKERQHRVAQIGESVNESCRKYDGTSKKKGGHRDGSGCKPADMKHHRHDHHGGGGTSGAGPSRAESTHKESSRREPSRKESSRKESMGKESSHKESSRKESKGKEPKGKGKESSSKSR